MKDKRLVEIWEPEDTAPDCRHGVMTYVVHEGRSGYVCPIPKGHPHRCESVMLASGGVS